MTTEPKQPGDDADSAGQKDAQQREQARVLAMLEQAHSFPCAFTFKAIGANTDTFAQAIEAAVAQALTPHDQAALQTERRASAHGRHLAVHVRAPMQDAAQVVRVYAQLRAVAGLTMLL